MIFSKILYEGTSEYTTLQVRQKRGTISLISGNKHVQSSYRPGKKPLGTVWDYFLVAPLFAPKPDEVKDVCILGLGAGVAVKLLNRVYQIERIVGVEVDKVVAYLGKEFFNLNDDNLEVCVQGAAEYVRENSEKPAYRRPRFDLVLIDTFKDDEIDPRCSCLEFYLNVIKLLKPEGIVLANRANTKKQEKTNKKFLLEFPRLFAQCYALTVRNNTFYFGLRRKDDRTPTHVGGGRHLGLQKPLKKQKIVERIKNLAAKGEFTRFLKDFHESGLKVFSISVHGKTLDPREELAVELH